MQQDRPYVVLLICQRASPTWKAIKSTRLQRPYTCTACRGAGGVGCHRDHMGCSSYFLSTLRGGTKFTPTLIRGGGGLFPPYTSMFIALASSEVPAACTHRCYTNIVMACFVDALGRPNMG